MVVLIPLPKNKLRNDSKLMISMKMDSFLKKNSGNVWISDQCGKNNIIQNPQKLLSKSGRKKKLCLVTYQKKFKPSIMRQVKKKMLMKNVTKLVFYGD